MSRSSVITRSFLLSLLRCVCLPLTAALLFTYLFVSDQNLDAFTSALIMSFNETQYDENLHSSTYMYCVCGIIILCIYVCNYLLTMKVNFIWLPWNTSIFVMNADIIMYSKSHTLKSTKSPRSKNEILITCNKYICSICSIFKPNKSRMVSIQIRWYVQSFKQSTFCKMGI